MNAALEFLQIAERLHYEARTTQMSNGHKESVSSHSWMMSLMAMVFAPRLHTPVDMERVLKLCTAHDLAEAKTHDIPLHEQVKSESVCKTKHECEAAAMESFRNILGEPAGAELMALWQEYEDQKTPEARFVKMLDKLDVDLQVACSQTLGYVGEYDDNVYWYMYFGNARAEPFRDEPALLEFFHAIQARIESRIRAELGLNPDDFKETNK